ncbi:hypothetical protein B0T11DRAFT_276177 [Plectosphaerella cucumerina]|uniref:Uncharacterized protein n=1 Tax=Plectosphaerella cucumerina TaxID=40658 RepID=A0A8K0X5K7_9PEZI|nr:hypothetical protein B0T11DRAFT_276177 [Plectosphaerella cucumerina]
MLPSQPPIKELPYLEYTTSWGRWGEGHLELKRPSLSNPDINARHDGWGPTANATNVDERGTCIWNMGHLYDMAMFGTWRIIWGVQAHLLREAANEQPYDSDADEYPLKANVRIDGPMVHDGSVDGSADLKIPLSDALKGHEVYFEGIYHRSCRGGSWGGGSSKLKRYYTFPAIDLDAPSSSSDDDWDNDEDDESEEEDDA